VSRAVSRFSAPTRIVAGLGALTGLDGEQGGLGHEPIAVVADRGVADAGVLDQVLANVARKRTLVVGLVDPDPTVADSEAASVAAREAGCGVVLMVGGGSALGVGKAVALRLTNPEPITAYEGRDCARRPPAPSVAVPTTAGSGSEVSNALVLHDPERERLLVVRGHGYEPDVAILDGELLVSLPHAPMLFAGLDALSHALEALWARAASSVTDALALAAARQIRVTLPRALQARDPIDLQRLLEASAIANLACGNAGLGLVHALSSATVVHLPHGLQNGILLPHVGEFNRAVMMPEALAEVDALRPLLEALDFTPRFAPEDLPAGAVDAMTAAALGNPFRDNNRRSADRRQLHELLLAAGVPASDRLVAPE
jgi:alcohol dehydrogenase class IV